MEIFKIAIDGPAGAGKSSIAKIISDKLNIEYVDSGAIYRAITKKMLDSNIKIDNYDEIENLMNRISIALINGHIFIDDADMTGYIRSREVTELVSPVSSNITVRKRVNRFLNEYSGSKSVIMDGRDIGTVVFPDAKYKFYLDASVTERAKRRYNEQNGDATLEEIKASIEKRDLNDKNKPFGALKIADGAIYIDTTDLSIDEVVEEILKKIK
ncbi:MAG TPA: (d)CMP kinase [Spirochaetota bacterium]|jgi:cytidylate kinase|nr:MAG: Cytidylate kinase [Spirochaetes bacterium ADurb.Bin133]HNZ26011.1 (d)CMP kinase [Spirochaetota bacterium]HOF01182.1 (d)CMP kinase [Spirochaetota bacterium]HOS32707.1 (d)CMP kinase [Spirochaetota bacterium]HOS55851.1 (d)CMP kinase [Spirochaetota bacterium]